MKPFATIELNHLFHVGEIDPNDSAITSRSSYEAFCLSVSMHPEEWSRIARLGGRTTWKLERDQSKFVDVHAFDSEQIDQVRDWAVMNEIALEQSLWKAWITNENGEWCYLICESKQEAIHETEDADIEIGNGPALDGTCVEEFFDLVLTEKGMAMLERWGDPKSGYEGALILFCRQILAPSDRDIVGIWWKDDYDPENLSCPRGGIFPERIDEFDRSPRSDLDDEVDPSPS